MPVKYIAASVPRNIRQTRFGHLPLTCVIGTRSLPGNNGTMQNFDVVMVPAQQFQRIRNGMSAQVVATPGPTMGGAGMMPVFVMSDAKEVTVPDGEPDPEAYARNYFIGIFGLPG